MIGAFLRTACAVIVGLVIAVPTFAADFNFKFAHSQPATSVRHKSMELFKDRLEKTTNDRIKVELFAASTLGNEGEVMDMVKMGTVQGTRGGAFAKANKKFLIYTLPFLFENTNSVLKPCAAYRCRNRQGVRDRRLLHSSHRCGGRLPPVHQQQEAHQHPGRRYRPEDAHATDRNHRQDNAGAGRQPPVYALRRNLHGAQDGRGGRTGEPRPTSWR